VQRRSKSTPQRALMRSLAKLHQGNHGAVVRAYARAESKGLVRRKSNAHGLSALQYASALLRDGLRKGWL
jgi:DNA-binding transcriptional MocR family regulator